MWRRLALQSFAFVSFFAVRSSRSSGFVKPLTSSSGIGLRSSHSQATSFHLRDESTSAKFLQYQLRLLRSIVNSPDHHTRKRRRVAGVLRKLENEAESWVVLSPENQETSRHCCQLLETLAAARPYLPKIEQAGSLSGITESREWTGASPLLSVALSDILCICVKFILSERNITREKQQRLMASLVELELPGEPLEALCRSLTHAESVRGSSTKDLCELLRQVSLAVKRCKITPPPLCSLFSELSSASALEQRDVLHILSSLVRLQSKYSLEISRRISQVGVDQVANYNTKDVVFALMALAYLPNIDEVYASKVLQRCCDLCPTFTAEEIGSVSKYVGLLHHHRERNHISHCCERELRRVVYRIADTSQQLLGRFSVRDARYVLRCLQEHNVKHALVFAHLVPLSVTS